MRRCTTLLACLLTHTLNAHAADTWYVWSQSPSNGPGTNWATAFHEIQAGVDAAGINDTVWVTNGVYSSGGRVVSGAVLTSRVAIVSAMTVRSVNGPEATIIEGNGPLGNAAVRCADVAANANLIGFTLTNGCTTWSGDEILDQSGAGARCAPGAVLSNCIDTGTDIAGLSNDLTGIARPLDGNNNGTNRMDIGAYEFVHAEAHSDNDGIKDADEITADTDPTDENIYLRMIGLSAIGADIRVEWAGGVHATQWLQRCDNLETGEWGWVTIWTNEPPTDPAATIIAPNTTNSPMFYRIAVPK